MNWQDFEELRPGHDERDSLLADNAAMRASIKTACEMLQHEIDWYDNIPITKEMLLLIQRELAQHTMEHNPHE